MKIYFLSLPWQYIFIAWFAKQNKLIAKSNNFKAICRDWDIIASSVKVLQIDADVCLRLVYVMFMSCLYVFNVLSMRCLCVVYVLSMSFLCDVKVLSISCLFLVYLMSMCRLCVAYVLSMSCICLVYVLSMSCLCLVYVCNKSRCDYSTQSLTKDHTYLYL